MSDDHHHHDTSLNELKNNANSLIENYNLVDPVLEEQQQQQQRRPRYLPGQAKRNDPPRDRSKEKQLTVGHACKHANHAISKSTDDRLRISSSEMPSLEPVSLLQRKGQSIPPIKSSINTVKMSKLILIPSILGLLSCSCWFLGSDWFGFC